MLPDGGETLARWREAGEWWTGETGREVHRFVDAEGIRRETFRDLPPDPAAEEFGVRVRQVRDEKVRLASGKVLPPTYGDFSAHSTPGVLLHALSGYAFGRGTMVAAEIPAFARHLGYEAALLADPFSLIGAREFAQTAETAGVQPLIGATFEMADGGELVLVARNRIGYRSLSRLITDCHLGEPRGYPLCNWDRLERHADDLLCLTGGGMGPLDRLLVRRDVAGAERVMDRLVWLYGRENVFVQIERSYLPWERSVESWLLQLAAKVRAVPVAGGPVLHERRAHFPTHDVLVCIESLCAIDEIEGRKPRRDPSQPPMILPPRRSLNAERFLRSVDDQRSLFADRPDLIENGWRLAERCEKEVLPGFASLPRFCENEAEVFHQRVWVGARRRYPTIGPRLRRRIDKEVFRIMRLGWERHFLIATEMCDWAREQGILLSGRGSVVDSVVAYCLDISRIDAFEFRLHFDRFLPADGSKRPDIDIDFEAARREDVRQHLVQRYGDPHVATVAAIGTYGSRGIVREVGKVMGIPEASIGYLAKRLHGAVTPERLESALMARPELRDSAIPKERFHWVFALAERMMDLPRNLRAHSSGVILSENPIADTVPVQLSGADDVKIVQWDKRSAKKCFDKFDVLCLRGNDVMGGAARNIGGGFDVTQVPLDDEGVFRTFRAGQLIGIPQSASPAMRQAHIRIGTDNLKDAGIVQAGIRPGVGGAVKLNEFVARRQGKTYRLVHEDLEAILGPTLGIVVFQEQIDQLLETFGGYTGDEAEEIRENIHKHHQRGYTEAVREDVLKRFLKKGYSRTVAQEVYELIAGFKGYGFAEGHALSFAEVSIRCVYLQQNHPAPYFAALLDAQPAGYYGPATIANEARVRGVQVLPPCVNASGERFGVEATRSDEDPKIVMPTGGIRVPLRQIGGVSAAVRERALLGRPYESFFDFVARTEPARDELEALVLSGAFDTLHPNRRSLLWAIPQALEHGATVRGMWGRLPLGLEDPPLPVGVEDFSPRERAIWERRLLGLDVAQHLMAFERERIAAKGGLTAAEASALRPGTTVFVVGNPIRLRFPPTQSGRRVMFFDLEDETGLLNVTCFDETYQRDGHKVICHPYVVVWGDTQDRDGHLSFLAHRMYAYEPKEALGVKPLPIVTADFLMT